jgi:hypothetical protein
VFLNIFEGVFKLTGGIFWTGLFKHTLKHKIKKYIFAAGDIVLGG